MLITKKVTVLKGVLGDLAAEWMTDEDWEKHNKYVKELEAKGEYGKPEEIEVSWIYHPIWDDRKPPISSTLESYSFDILDFSKP